MLCFRKQHWKHISRHGSVIQKHREVVKFACGLMPDPRPLVDHVYTTLNEYVLEEMRTSHYIPSH